jgi:hypothetical protein
MAVRVVVGEVRNGLIVPDGPQVLPEGARVTVVVDVPEKGLVAVDPEDAELIRALHEAEWKDARGRLAKRWPQRSS